LDISLISRLEISSKLFNS